MPDVASGWGRLTYGQAHWGDATTIKQGWGRLDWGSQAYGDSPTVTLSGISATASVGAPTVEVRLVGVHLTGVKMVGVVLKKQLKI